ncbi:MAG: AI-2E family transporter [Planctomycetota bacterium]|jgi:predicted PurR-regulated permease PerM
MEKSERKNRAFMFIVTLAAFVIVIAGLRAAATILIPVILSVFLAVVCSGPYAWLKSKKLPTVLAIILIVLGVLVIAGLLGTLVGTSVDKLIKSIPRYSEQMAEKTKAFKAWLQEHHIAVHDQVFNTTFEDVLNPQKAFKLVADLLGSVTNMFTQTLLIVLTMIFILVEISGFPDKLRAGLGEDGAYLDRFRLFADNLRRYLGIKTLISLATGIAVAVFLKIVGVDFPVLWGILAFLLNFIPNVGSILASIPAILLALIQFGFGTTVVTAIGYVVINISISVSEPRLMGIGLGLSTLTVFLSLIFWGWVFGPMGMLISVPMTMTVKIALDTFEETRWIGLLLGTESAARTALPGQGKVGHSRP